MEILDKLPIMTRWKNSQGQLYTGEIELMLKTCVRLFPHAINKLFKEINIKEEGILIEAVII